MKWIYHRKAVCVGGLAVVRAAILVFVVGLIHAAWTSTVEGSFSAIYDPLGNAIVALQAEGYPPPAGYTIKECKPGELGDIPARHDLDKKEIKVDVATVLQVVDDFGGGPEAAEVALMVFLRHEYHHTAEYGTPSAGGEGGYGRDFCGHCDIVDDDFQFMCSLACPGVSAETREAVCKHLGGLIDSYNDYVDLRNLKCPSGGPYPLVVLTDFCECCL